MQPTLNIALRAARIAGEQVARALERLDILRTQKEDPSSFLRDTARGAEKSLAYQLRKTHPEDSVEGYHGGMLGSTEETTATHWQINPIDGLSSFSRNLPDFALSLCCLQQGRVEHLVILNPISGDEFTASRGRGAQLNGKRIRVSPVKQLEGSLLGSGLAAKSAELDTHYQICTSMARAGAEIRDYGSPVLSLAWLASGRLDAAWFLGLDRWQLAPCLLLLQESGALSGDFRGGSSFLERGELVAANPRLFKVMLQTLKNR